MLSTTSGKKFGSSAGQTALFSIACAQAAVAGSP
jgi:hypothetical protein